MLRPSPANRTIRARFKSRCNVTGERQRASSILRSSAKRGLLLLRKFIPILITDDFQEKRVLGAE